MAKKPVKKLAENETLNGSNTLPATIEISEGNTVQLGDVVLAAFSDSGMTVEAWNLLDEATRDGLLNQAIETMKSGETDDDEATGPTFTVTRRFRHNGQRVAAGDYAFADLRKVFKDDEEASFLKLVKSGVIVAPKDEESAS
jgi:hypothetical protein